MDRSRLARWLTGRADVEPRRRLLQGALGAALGAAATTAAAKKNKKKKKKNRCGKSLHKLAGRCVERCETSDTCGQAFCRFTFDEEAKACAFFDFTGNCNLLDSCVAHDECTNNELCLIFESCTGAFCGQVSFG